MELGRDVSESGRGPTNEHHFRVLSGRDIDGVGDSALPCDQLGLLCHEPLVERTLRERGRGGGKGTGAGLQQGGGGCQGDQSHTQVELEALLGGLFGVVPLTALHGDGGESVARGAQTPVGVVNDVIVAVVGGIPQGNVVMQR